VTACAYTRGGRENKMMAWIWEKQTYTILLEKPLRMKLFKRLRCMKKDIIKEDLKLPLST
jgi:hypothetical protein